MRLELGREGVSCILTCDDRAMRPGAADLRHYNRAVVAALERGYCFEHSA